MFQEIAAFSALLIVIYSLVGKLFFKKKKSGNKNSGVSDCDIH